MRVLGERQARTQDQRPGASFDLERARSRLLESVRVESGRRVRVQGWTAGLLTAVAAAILVLVLRKEPLEFQVGGHSGLGSGLGSGLESRAGRAGDWIAAPVDQSVPINFSDGTELTLMASARARVVDVDPDGATVIVERGLLRASIVRRQQTGWRIFVGPFQVRVTGTQFDVGWQPETERFSLTLREGSVVVTGPTLDGERILHAGEELDISRRDRPQSLVHPEAPPAPAALSTGIEQAPSAQLGPGSGPASPRPAEQVRPHEPAQTRAARAPDFRELARASKHREALAAAERAGFEQLCQTAGVDDVLLLADVARLGGDVERARFAYRAVRERFAGRDGGQAAFFLGRLAFDRDADYALAARLFALSIAEQPDGPLAREAAGRLLEAKLRLADTPGARAAARQYLERYPDGPHAKSAESLLRAP